ncbi:MAG: cytochrome P450 [Candidatus Saccharibacteria bacterium]|nr:cytochrome P450 [Pseudorhodobacter sp.]
MLAGHETTANALGWAFIHSGKGQITGDAAPIHAEAVRMYPSIWVIERQAVQDDQIGGFDLKRGSFVLILPYTLHRHPDFWPDPEQFDPSRFTGDTLRLRDGYLPYGLDQHRCIGLHLASALAVRIIYTVLARFRLHLLPRQVAATIAGITLRHKTPVQIQAEAR